MKRAGVWLVLATLAAGGCSEHNREAIESNNQGMALLRANRFSDAREKFQRAAEEDPRYDVPLYNLALAFIRQRNWSDAADALSRAISRNANNAEYHYQLGNAHYQIATAPENADNGQGGAHLEQARTSFQAAIQRNRNVYMAHFRLGQVAEALDNPQDALRAYTDAIMVAPRWYASYTRLGRLYYRNHLYDAAETVLREGLRIAPPGAPERGQMHNYLGLSLLGRHQDLPATEEFIAAIADDPNVHEALYQLGVTYAAMPDHHPQAILYLNQFITANDPNFPREFRDHAQNLLQELQTPATPQ